MIPILYEANETAFVSNGIGRLYDCISFDVTEERNGVFEADFQVPVDGVHFDDITCGRIVYGTHDDTRTPQPFDIVSYSKPINGVVTFHAEHITYRTRKIIATARNINSLDDALRAMVETAQPSNEMVFNLSADFESSGYMAAFDMVPRSIRQLLGGIEGSVLDTYGGEYEWDTFNITLHKARGVTRDFKIRYGVNMLDYTDDTDYSGSYVSCVPFWKGADETGAETIIYGNVIESGGVSYTGRNECAPLDLSDKFEEAPTQEELETMAQTYMRSHQTYLPQQNIKVDFVRLQDMGYSGFDELLQCNLCDTIGVEFPEYNMQGSFKIVKIVYDTLEERYKSMELGALATSLADALGILNTLGNTNGGASGDDLNVRGDLNVGGDAAVVGNATVGGNGNYTGTVFANNGFMSYRAGASELGFRTDGLLIKEVRPSSNISFTSTSSNTRIACATNVFGSNSWLTLNSDGTITVNADCYVKVWGFAYITGLTTGDAIYLLARRNGTAATNQYYRAAGASDSFVLMPSCFGVSAGDVIDFAGRNSTAVRGAVQASTFTKFSVQVMAPS